VRIIKMRKRENSWKQRWKTSMPRSRKRTDSERERERDGQTERQREKERDVGERARQTPKRSHEDTQDYA